MMEGIEKLALRPKNLAADDCNADTFEEGHLVEVSAYSRVLERTAKF
jgi:hypothetical protein